MTGPLLVAVLVGMLPLAGCAEETPVGGQTQAFGAATSGPPGTPLPEYDPSTQVGALAKGFPAKTIPVPEGAEILASSAGPTADGTLWSATLNVKSDRPTAEVAAFFAGRLAAAGFAPGPGRAAGGMSSMVTYVRQTSGKPTESVLVGVLDDGTDRLVTVSARVVPGAVE